MINDEMTWHCINQGFCSFKVKLKQPPQTFCRNQYNVTGLCNRVSCPLANSQYATVLEKEGVCYLYMKTVERAHTPAKLWEKVKLSKNYAEAVKQIADNLIYWPDHMINRCKQRLTKIRQMIIRQRKLALSTSKPTLVTVKQKTEKREATREAKAEKAAKVDLAIEKELLDRLKQGTYGSLYANIDQKAFDNIMDNEMNVDDEMVENMEMEDELDDERDIEYVEGIEDFSDGDSDLDDDELAALEDEMKKDGVSGGAQKGPVDMEDLGAMAASLKKNLKKKTKKPKLEIEYEMEEEKESMKH